MVIIKILIINLKKSKSPHLNNIKIFFMDRISGITYFDSFSMIKREKGERVFKVWSFLEFF